MNRNESFPSVIDSTIRSIYVSCPRQFYWNAIRHLRKHNASIHLHFGKVFAVGLETYRIAFYRDHLPKHECEAAAARAMLLQWGDWEESDQDGLKTLDRCLLAIDSYFKEYPPGTDIIQPYMTEKGPSVEFTFALPLGINHPETGEPILYAGRFDLLGIYNNHLWVVDEKTTLRLGPSWGNSWIMRGQFLGYVKAAQEHNIHVNGTIVRGTSILKESYGHAQIILPVQQWKVEEWWEQLHQDVSNMIADWHYGRFSKVFGDACSSYNGCSYLPLCDAPDPERWVSQYSIVHWNPLTQEESI